MTSTEHDELREQAELYVVGALAPSDRAKFEAHVNACAECQATVKALSVVADALSQALPQHEPAPAVRTRVLTSVGAGRGGVGPMPTSSTRSRPSMSIAPWLAAAASLVVAVALGGYATAMRARVATLEMRLREAVQRADLNERRIADLRRASAEAQSQMAVVAAPDLQRIDLAGQPAAPRSVGRAFWSRSRGLVFTASNLPALPAGKTYQLWVLTKQPTPISAGLFKPDAGGHVTSMFETPVDLPQPVGMAVTIEPDGGVPAPSGDKYLVSP